ncbi:hypothetical protein HK102_010950, partial [Quaeritorhiza haematococci]
RSLTPAEPLYPPVPPIAREPLRIGGVAIPSRFFLAPLAGYTSLAFRLAVRDQGGLGLATTDLVNARSLIEKRRRALELAETSDADKPLSIQIYGQVPSEMEQAARYVAANGATIVDINMGCPVRKETLSAPGLARAFEQIGVAAVIVHGRTRAQGFSGSVNRSGIKAVVDAVDSMPIVANGDVRSIADAASMIADTGCAAVSIGRGALANPFFFRQLDHWVRTGEPGPDPTFEQRLDFMSVHFHGLLERRGEHYACLQFRKILKWYYHFTRMPKKCYLELINLRSSEVFDRAVAQIRGEGPSSPLPGHFEAHVPVPSGPIEAW